MFWGMLHGGIVVCKYTYICVCTKSILFCFLLFLFLVSNFALKTRVLKKRILRIFVGECLKSFCGNFVLENQTNCFINSYTTVEQIETKPYFIKFPLALRISKHSVLFGATRQIIDLSFECDTIRM